MNVNQKDIQDFLNEQLEHDAMKELQSMLNKEFAKPQNQRDYSRISEITDAYAESVSERYIELYEHIVGEQFDKATEEGDIAARIEKNVSEYLKTL